IMFIRYSALVQRPATDDRIFLRPRTAALRPKGRAMAGDGAPGHKQRTTPELASCANRLSPAPPPGASFVGRRSGAWLGPGRVQPTCYPHRVGLVRSKPEPERRYPPVADADPSRLRCNRWQCG